jgi:hypothetical protein
VLRQQASHDDFSVLLRAGVLAFAAVELIGHPLRKRPLVRLDGRELLGVFGHVVREGVGELGREGFATLESVRSETKCCSLKTRIAGRHVPIIARRGLRDTG